MGLKVLIVDDDDVVLFLHRVMVVNGKLHSDPLTFLNGKEALHYLVEKGNTENEFLILLDINMPVMNGWTFLDEVNKHSFKDKVSVIMVTSSVNKHDREKSFLYSQIIHFAEKPISIDICEKFKTLPQIASLF